jgi:hypothetical protein
MTHEEQFNKLFAKYGIKHPDIKRIEEIGSLIDDAVMCLWTYKFDINELDHETPDELDRETYMYLNDRYGETLKNIPLEMIYYYGIIDTISYNCFLYERAYGMSKDEISNAYKNNIESFTGRFTDKMEDIFINKLGVKSLIKNQGI